ncbi:MAG TPA: PEP/pyruvate-binding domain-containing protein [Blastocatellia bacterium]|nr:PEP/pyruvate-binding domain-containing protein [Blastocatellia bacterium]
MSKSYNPSVLCVVASIVLHLNAAPVTIASATTQGDDILWLDSVHSRDDFDRLSRIYYRGRFYALPHLMFVIDRQERSRIYYVNSRKFRFHKDFVNGTHRSLERGLAFYEDNYLKDNRRFILGSIAYQQAAEKFTFELWEGDLAGRELIAEAYQCLKRTFYTDIYYKPNSDRQEEIGRQLETETAHSSSPIRLLTQSQLSENLAYQPLNLAKGLGQLRVLDHMTPDTVIDRNQIVIFKEVPVHLTPLSGIITTAPASPLSHINLLARGWGIPNAYIKNADRLFRSLEGKYVALIVREDGYELVPANVNEVEQRQRDWVKRADLVTPPADLTYRALTDLKDQRANDARRFGAKSANLGELIHARNPALQVPPGFTIPFSYYADFIKENHLEQKIADTVEEDKFVHDPAYRKRQLAAIRQWIETGKINPQLARSVAAKAHKEFPGLGLFARSSTNAEDLPNFSGAGLYTTVPNVTTDEQLSAAIKTVWASVWNYEAYEARESFGMNHFGVYPAVLIQVGINADSAGVVITCDPFNQPEGQSPADTPFQTPSAIDAIADGTPAEKHEKHETAAIYINAKRGLGMKVVEGRRVAEQVIYRPRADTIEVLTRSNEDSMLQFDEKGGLKEIKIDQDRRVLTDAMVRKLASAAIDIKRVFKDVEQDIEWVFAKGQLYIVQSRPFIPSP